MDWRDRFRAPTVRTAEVARDRPERGVVISDQDGAFQAYGWHVHTGELWPVTTGDSATIHAAISHDGEWIFYLEEHEAGTEIGHLHRVPFRGGPSQDLTPELAPYAAYSIFPLPSGLAALTGLADRPQVLVVEGGDIRAFPLETLPQGFAPDPGGTVAAVSEATPGEGLVSRTRILDLHTGAMSEPFEGAAAGAMHDGRVAVTQPVGDWKRPAVWTPGRRPEALEVDIPGDVVPVDWSTDGRTILLFQTHRGEGGLAFYSLVDGTVQALPVPVGSPYPQSTPRLDGAGGALVVWSDAHHPWRAIRCTPEGWSVVVEAGAAHPGADWEEFTYPSGDVEIQGWLLRPHGTGPWPTILYTHGGPTSAAGPSFNPINQAFVDQGFAVASINYRGSTTFSEAFRESLTGAVGGPDIADVVAARHWLVEQGIARDDLIIKNGYSYGGYLTLQALGAHPDLWAGGIAGAPIADWPMSYEDANPILRAYQVSLFGGTPDEVPELQRRASPRTYIDDYSVPLLISQPEADSRTPMRPVQAFVDELRARGGQVELQALQGGHAGAGTEQMIEMVERWLDFAAGIAPAGE